MNWKAVLALVFACGVIAPVPAAFGQSYPSPPSTIWGTFTAHWTVTRTGDGGWSGSRTLSTSGLRFTASTVTSTSRYVTYTPNRGEWVYQANLAASFDSTGVYTTRTENGSWNLLDTSIVWDRQTQTFTMSFSFFHDWVNTPVPSGNPYGGSYSESYTITGNVSGVGTLATFNCSASLGDSRRYGSATDTLQTSGTLSGSETPTIESPRTNATPASYYVALTGRGKANGKVLLRDSNPGPIPWVPVVVDVEANGEWEKVVYLTGSGSHSLTAEDFDDSTLISSPTVITPNPGPVPNARVFTDYGNLKKADVILCRSNASHQLLFYGPQYSHVALYIGGDSNGTPLIAEAIQKSEARGLGEVRRVPLEQSTIYTGGDFVDFFRSISTLSKAQKAAIVNWTIQTTSRNLPYWSVSELGSVLKPRIWWSSTLHQPWNETRFNAALTAMDSLKRSTDKYICSTLVWQAYQQAGIDLSTPNNARISGILADLDPEYVDRIRPYFVYPDTILYSGKLAQVN